MSTRPLAITGDDIVPGETFYIADGMSITPRIVTVTVKWLDRSRDEVTYHKQGDLPHQTGSTTVRRFLEIINLWICLGRPRI